MNTTEVVRAIEHFHAVLLAEHEAKAALLAENEALKLGNAAKDGRLAEQKDYISGLRADHVQMLGIIESLHAQLKQFQSAMRDMSPRVEAFNGTQIERSRQSHAIEETPQTGSHARSHANGTARIGSLAARLEAAGAGKAA